MCGISGIFALASDRTAHTTLLRAMTELIAHRGPDDEGYWLWRESDAVGQSYGGASSSDEVKQLLPALPEEAGYRLGLGFRRLAILDLSVSGHQPMSDHARDLHIVFNGEIYNYVELRGELRSLGYEFVSASDTEVILKAYHAWGDSCVERFNGIWAFALWDGRQRRLFCSRDRFGVKPFYCCLRDGVLYFGSELKQLLLTPVDKKLNLPMLWRSVQINSLQVYGPETYWRDISALEPGHNLVAAQGRLSQRCYHRLDPQAFAASRLDFNAATERYRELFQRAVRWQMRSDVEVGSCLSGGLDSSAIVCTASQLSGRALQTFSSYFASCPQLDERRWISTVARQCGCESHLTSPGAEQAASWFAEATWHNDLPLAAGFAAQYAVLRLAQGQGIKVLLDGQGSDELTAGYRHAQYRWLAQLFRQGKWSTLAREKLAFLNRNGLLKGVSGLTKSMLCAVLPESRLYEFEFRRLRFIPFSADFTGQCQDNLQEPILARIADLPGDRLANFLYNMVYTTSLPTLLHWEDRMSMAASIESRVPFLDHELAEFAFTLPASYKIHAAQGKRIHRAALRSIVPQEISGRRDKAVFGSPFHQLWMRGELRHNWTGLFASAAFRQRGIWNLPRIQAEWSKYLKGDLAQAEMLFNIYALETWFRVWEGQISQ
ncbi:MAG TPA: asparagine synthase (glutamine-hydrolyzing) [Candidatus Syntrophosphaera sp.]|nr:asparagine synthase (glutamine-hydrolyzing) [Candidatus Syntrophosphaera sp.]